MKRALTVPAWAKINLTLDVLSERQDGYHDLRMVMQSVSLRDTVRVAIGTGASLLVRTNLSFLPDDNTNLAAVAAERFCAAAGLDLGGLSLEIEKSIPVCAGLGGGSSDAAATLRALNELTATGFSDARLAEIGAQVGSDVPYCVFGGTALAEGRGELLTRLPVLPHCWVVLCKPEFRISTPQLFAALNVRRIVRRPDTAGVCAALEQGDLGGVARRLYNVFEDALDPRRATVVAAVKAMLLEWGALGAVMSGTGPTVFGLFDDVLTAQSAANALARQYEEVFLAEPV